MSFESIKNPVTSEYKWQTRIDILSDLKFQNFDSLPVIFIFQKSTRRKFPKHLFMIILTVHNVKFASNHQD